MGNEKKVLEDDFGEEEFGNTLWRLQKEKRKWCTIRTFGVAEMKQKEPGESRLFLYPPGECCFLEKGNKYSVTKTASKECQFRAFQEQTDSKK